jgi:hypothetical protein
MADSRKAACLLLKLAALAMLVLVSYLALLYGVLAVDRNDNYFLANSDKLRRLKEARHPKLVLIGGSNLAFGVDSARIRDALGMTVVNMGVTIDFGLKMMLDQVAPYLGQGDVVVVVPEYENFCGDAFYGCGVGLLDLAALRENRADLDVRQLVVLANSAMRDSARIFGYKPARPQAGNDPAAVIFTRSSFNQDGDITTHLKLPPRKVPEYPLDAQLNGAAAEYVRDFAALSARSGVTTLVLFPPLPKGYYQRHASLFEEVALELRGKGVPLLSAPRDFVYDERLFFDSVYHLNAEGRALRTEKMIRILSATLPARQKAGATGS